MVNISQNNNMCVCMLKKINVCRVRNMCSISALLFFSGVHFTWCSVCIEMQVGLYINWYNYCVFLTIIETDWQILVKCRDNAFSCSETEILRQQKIHWHGILWVHSFNTLNIKNKWRNEAKMWTMICQLITPLR